MKIRNGFVTNSSSTSFLISLKKDWKKEYFMTWLGAVGTSIMIHIFEELFKVVDMKKKDIHTVIKEWSDGRQLTVSEFLSDRGFDSETVDVVKKLIADGRTVYYGELSDAGEASESYFCTRSFIVSEDDIYFNGSIGSW